MNKSWKIPRCAPSRLVLVKAVLEAIGVAGPAVGGSCCVVGLVEVPIKFGNQSVFQQPPAPDNHKAPLPGVAELPT